MGSAVVVFVRAPEPGRCKTRLCPPLAPGQAAALYRAFCCDVLANAQRTRLPVWIAYDASDDFPAPDWVSPRLPFFHQEGADLGERLIHAFETLSLRGCRRVVAIGSDSPTLPRERLTAAFELLADYAAVFGPAEDGGYYLGPRSPASPRRGPHRARPLSSESTEERQMAWIRMIDEADATGELKAAYAEVSAARGRVANILKVHGVSPATVTSHLDLTGG